MGAFIHLTCICRVLIGLVEAITVRSVFLLFSFVYDIEYHLSKSCISFWKNLVGPYFIDCTNFYQKYITNSCSLLGISNFFVHGGAAQLP